MEQTNNLIDVLNAQAGVIKIKDAKLLKEKIQMASPFLLKRGGRFIGGINKELLLDNKNKKLMEAVMGQITKAKERKTRDMEVRKTEETRGFHRNKLRLLAQAAQVMSLKKAEEQEQQDIEDELLQDRMYEDARRTAEELILEEEKNKEIEAALKGNDGNVDIASLESSMESSLETNTPQIEQNIDNGDQGDVVSNVVSSVAEVGKEILDQINRVIQEEEMIVGQLMANPEEVDLTVESLPEGAAGAAASPLVRAKMLAQEIAALLKQAKERERQKRKGRTLSPSMGMA